MDFTLGLSMSHVDRFLNFFDPLPFCGPFYKIIHTSSPILSNYLINVYGSFHSVFSMYALLTYKPALLTHWLLPLSLHSVLNIIKFSSFRDSYLFKTTLRFFSTLNFFLAKYIFPNAPYSPGLQRLSRESLDFALDEDSTQKGLQIKEPQNGYVY